MWVIRDFRAWIRKGKHNGINNSNPPTTTTVQVPVTVFTMSSFDNRMTFVIKNWIHINVNHPVGKALYDEYIHSYVAFQAMDPTVIQRLDFESRAPTANTPAIRKKLPEYYVIMIRNTIEYIQYLEATGDEALVDDPIKCG